MQYKVQGPKLGGQLTPLSGLPEPVQSAKVNLTMQALYNEVMPN